MMEKRIDMERIKLLESEIVSRAMEVCEAVGCNYLSFSHFIAGRPCWYLSTDDVKTTHSVSLLSCVNDFRGQRQERLAEQECNAARVQQDIEALKELGWI